MTTATPAQPGTLDERIVASSERLAPAEDRVARFFAEHRDEVAFLSAADIAESLGTSGATVVRAAQALGYSGFPELKEELRDQLRTRRSPVARLGRSLDQLGEDTDAVLDHVLGLTTELLTDARSSLRPADFRYAVELLRKSSRVVVLGLGPNRGLTDLFVQSLRRFGRRAVHLITRGHGLADELMELGKGDVLVVVAHERVTNELTVPLDLARERGVPSILITDVLALALEGRYTVALSAMRGTTETYPITAIALVILEALLVGLAGRDRARTLAALDELNSLREQLGSL